MRLSLAMPVFILALASPALAGGPLDGRWAFDREVCADQPGQGDVVASVIDGNEITHYESRCTITEMTPIGMKESAWRVRSNCSGEGEEYSRDEDILALDLDQDGKPRQLIAIDMEDGFVVVRQRCP